ncbi:MAG: restriction endonuclease subunit S [Bacteroidales bacterium]|nr:restriction endonuclease subunit S [Bacteroidales bacterium]
MKPPTNDIIPQGFKMTELEALPEEWEVVKLGQVADISSGGSAPQGDKYFNGDKPFVRVSHIDNQNYSINKYDLINDNAINDYRLKLFPKGTIVFPKSGATVYLEKRAMLPIDAYVVSHLCTVISNKEKAIQHFLFYVLISLKLAKEKADGYPTLNISEVKQIPIPLPPLLEQQKIAAVLSAVQEAKEKTEAVIAATKALKKTMMKHLFTYGPVSPEEAETVPLKETEIGPVPEDWEVVRLENIFRITSGKARPKILKESPAEPYIFPVFGGNGIIGYSNEFLIEYPTIILGRVGEYCGSAHISQGKCWVSDNALYVNYFKRKIDLKFLLNALEILNLNKLKNRGGQPLISQSVVYSQSIPLPPFPTQQKIASILSAIDAKIEAEENKKKALEELFKSLLHNLMTANIRVNQMETVS